PWAGVAAATALVAVAAAELALVVLAVSHPLPAAVPNAALLFHGGLGADPLGVSRSPLLTHTFSVKRDLFALLIAMSVGYLAVLTLGPYPLGLVSIPAAVWILKLVAIVSGVAALGLVWKCAQRLRRPAVPAVLAVGLNPLFLVYGVGGAHNDLLMVMLLLGGL